MLKRKYTKFRQKILKKLKSKSIGFSIYYPGPVPLFNYYKKKYKLKSSYFPNSKYLSDSIISLPIAPHIDIRHIKYITVSLKKILNEIDKWVYLKILKIKKLL